MLFRQVPRPNVEGTPSLQLMAYRSYCRIKALVIGHFLFTVKTVCLHGESEMDGLSQGWKPCTYFSSTTFPTVDSSATALAAACLLLTCLSAALRCKQRRETVNKMV